MQSAGRFRQRLGLLHASASIFHVTCQRLAVERRHSTPARGQSGPTTASSRDTSSATTPQQRLTFVRTLYLSPRQSGVDIARVPKPQLVLRDVRARRTDHDGASVLWSLGSLNQNIQFFQCRFQSGRPAADSCPLATTTCLHFPPLRLQ